MFLMGGQAERTTRHYPMDALQSLSGSPGGHNTPRRWQPRRERHPNSKNADNTAFGYDSDDSSLSSNASGSNKSGEKGKSLQYIIQNISTVLSAFYDDCNRLKY